MTLFDKMKSFNHLNDFREIYKKFLYIECKDLLTTMFPDEIRDDITGFLVYCYIDRAEGLSFRPLLLASMRTDAMQVFNIPHLEDTIYILRLREGQMKMSEYHEQGMNMYLYSVDPSKNSFIDLSVLNVNVDDFKEFKEMIDTSYAVSHMIEIFRTEEKWRYLDCYRNYSFPDDVRVLLVNQNSDVEQVWVRLAFISDDGKVFGELLNEPINDHGCHVGNLIEISEVNAGDDKVLIFTGTIAMKKNDLNIRRNHGGNNDKNGC